jgi:EAL domain-containing protein (putative c-di-GMP-specific phosphodiesterase class I)
MSAKTMNAGGVAERLEKLLGRHPIPDGLLVLEVTETAAISNMELARDLARDVRSLGARVALDDFGAGFATFYYLKHLDFDYVKIDGEFIRHLPDNHADQLVVKSVVDIARGLGADTIAEFVQDDHTLDLLRRFGVGYAQGYHTGRPGPIDTALPDPGTTYPSPDVRTHPER